MLIKIKDLSKHYYLSTFSLAFSFLSMICGKHKVKTKERVIKAVENVTFTICEGERVGIIGHNGAGKTSLLQMISGLSKPTSGHIDVEGHVNCIMTLGIGLREELTGRENIYIDGEINGKSRSEVFELIDDIIEFADIGAFIDYPVRTYSSGMKTRLAFSMIIHIDPEILIIDEALSAGDANFSAKASAKIKDICDRGKIQIIVSHSMGTIVDMCNRCIWMGHGKILQDGGPEEITKAYAEFVRKEDEMLMQKKFSKRIGGTSIDNAFEIEELIFLDENRIPKSIFHVGECLTISFSIRCSKLLINPDFRITFERSDGIIVTENIATEDGYQLNHLEGKFSFEIPLGSLCFGKNTYEVQLELIDKSKGTDGQILALRKQVLKIENIDYPHENPIVFHACSWELQDLVHTK